MLAGPKAAILKILRFGYLDREEEYLVYGVVGG
jgi:hypothetical protein